MLNCFGFLAHPRAFFFSSPCAGSFSFRYRCCSVPLAAWWCTRQISFCFHGHARSLILSSPCSRSFSFCACQPKYGCVWQRGGPNGTSASKRSMSYGGARCLSSTTFSFRGRPYSVALSSDCGCRFHAQRWASSAASSEKMSLAMVEDCLVAVSEKRRRARWS